VAGDGPPKSDNKAGARPRARKPTVIVEYEPPIGRDFPFAGVVPRVFLLRRPGHFDILYR
jgi:hypothetical protein